MILQDILQTLSMISRRTRDCVIVVCIVLILVTYIHRKRHDLYVPAKTYVQSAGESLRAAKKALESLPSLVLPGMGTPDIYKGISNFTVPTQKMLYPLSQDNDLDRKVFDMTLPKIPFLPHYKNPCWFEPLEEGNIYDAFENHTYAALMKNLLGRLLQPMKGLFEKRIDAGDKWRIRCLPFFYVPGVSKCGSTDLFSAIHKHPDVTKAPMKEPIFWNRIGMETPQMGVGWMHHVWRRAAHIRTPKPVVHYFDLFDHAAEDIRTSLEDASSIEGRNTEYHHKILGDGSPSYFYDFDGWTKLAINKGRSEPLYSIADLIAELTPNAKIIIIVRNPTDRLYSDYKFFPIAEKLTPEDFHERAVIAIDKMKECLATRTVRACIYDRNLTSHSMPLRLRIGMYSAFLKDWFKAIPRENFFITRLEDYGSNREKVLSELFKFLDLREILNEQNEMKVRNKSKVPKAMEGGMLNKTRILIDNFYRDWNRKLADLLGDEKYVY